MNTVNQTYGGGAKQAAAIANGDFFVFVADDVEVFPNWLSVLTLPFEVYPERKYVGALHVGKSVRHKQIRNFYIGDEHYKEETRAGAYLWGMTKETYLKYGPWPTVHFADTWFANNLTRHGYVWILPKHGKYIRDLNLNYKRPWKYRYERGIKAIQRTEKYLNEVWESGELLRKEPPRPKQRFQLIWTNKDVEEAKKILGDWYPG